MGELHVTKECSEYTGQAGDHCSITGSDLEAIVVGSKVVYAEAASGGTLDTDIALNAGAGNTAVGHVVLDLSAATGVVTFSGGTGTLAGFTAKADVSADPSGLWHWDGTYSFGTADSKAEVGATA